MYSNYSPSICSSAIKPTPRNATGYRSRTLDDKRTRRKNQRTSGPARLSTWAPERSRLVIAACCNPIPSDHLHSTSSWIHTYTITTRLCVRDTRINAFKSPTFGDCTCVEETSLHPSEFVQVLCRRQTFGKLRDESSAIASLVMRLPRRPLVIPRWRKPRVSSAPLKRRCRQQRL